MTHPFADETLMRRADGELPPGQAQAVDDAAARDPALATRLESFRSDRIAVRDAFPATTDQRDHDLTALIAAVAPARVGAPAAGSRKAKIGFMSAMSDRLRVRSAAIWGGLAATGFVAGVLVSPLIGVPGDPSALVGPSGRLVDPALVRVLDSRLAGDGPDSAGRAVGLTYRDADGQWCRTFTAPTSAVAGLACRRQGDWSLRALAPLETSSSEIRTAASEIPASILAAVDNSLADDPVDAAAEAVARQSGWATKR